MSTRLVCLSSLRYISASAAAILDRYSPDRAGDQAVWVPAPIFEQFIHTLCWGNFSDLDLNLLESLDNADRIALQAELRAYYEYLRRQRQRVDRFHRAYRDWLDKRERELPRVYLERLRHWRQRYGPYTYLRITGLTTMSGFQRFMADPEGHMAVYEQWFAELAEEQTYTRQSETDAGWFSDRQPGDKHAGLLTEIEQALRLLGVSANATLAEIRQAYRTRAKMLHPDWQGEERTGQMASLNAAYHVLCKWYHQ